MVEDRWLTILEALEFLGESWHFTLKGPPGSCGSIVNTNGTKMVRVFGGKEHPQAQRLKVLKHSLERMKESKNG